MFYDNVTQNKHDRIKFVKANILEIKNKKWLIYYLYIYVKIINIS
jgi:hypothetical protein